jgi:hypothetical protein
MKPKAMRAVRAQAPRQSVAGRRRRAPILDATMEPAPGPLPEVVFDRVTGPYRAPRGRGEAS